MTHRSEPRKDCAHCKGSGIISVSKDPDEVADCVCIEVETTQTGIPIRMCGECGRLHPVTRPHCPTCGRASLFCHHPRTEEGGADV